MIFFTDFHSSLIFFQFFCFSLSLFNFIFMWKMANERFFQIKTENDWDKKENNMSGAVGVINPSITISMKYFMHTFISLLYAIDIENKFSNIKKLISISLNYYLLKIYTKLSWERQINLLCTFCYFTVIHNYPQCFSTYLIGSILS